MSFDPNAPQGHVPPIPPPPPLPPYPPAPPTAAGPGVPAAAPPPKRSKVGRIGWIAGVVALVGVLGAGVVAVMGNESGAGGPEGAVRQLATAVSNEDVLGAAKVLPPAEVGSAPELYDLVIKVMQKNDALSPAGKPLAGVDIKIENLSFRTDKVSDRVSKVYLTGGTVGYDVNASAIDPEIRRQMEDRGEDVEDMSDVVSIDRIRREFIDATHEFGSFFDTGGAVSGLYLMTVKEGDRWYVSYQYTMLEIAREMIGVEPPTFAEPPSSPGAESPEALFSGIVSYVNNLDSSALREQLEKGTAPTIPGMSHPREFRAFVDYGEVFSKYAQRQQGLSDPNSSALDVFDDVDVDVQLDLQPDVRTTGDRAIVSVKSGKIEATIKGIVFDEKVDSRVTATVTGGTCVAWQSSSLDRRGRRQTDRGNECADVFAGTQFSGFFFVATKEKGGWYVSPVETVVQYVRYALEAELAK